MTESQSQLRQVELYVVLCEHDLFGQSGEHQVTLHFKLDLFSKIEAETSVRNTMGGNVVH